MSNTFYLYVKEFYSLNGIEFRNFNQIGIRNNNNNDLDYFNDWIGYTWNGQLFLNKGTTDPGKHYTYNPMNIKGAFHLSPGYQYNIWRFRKHRGQHIAFCNDWRTKKVRGWRDKNQNFTNDEDTYVYEWVGANLHTTNQKLEIKMASAGCPVVNNKEFFYQMRQDGKESGQKLFSFYLYLIEEIPTNLKIELGNIM